MEKLRDELKKVAKIAPKGSHKKVAKKVGYSEQYIQQIRTGKTLTLNNDKNISLIKDLLSEYRRLIRAESKKYQSI